MSDRSRLRGGVGEDNGRPLIPEPVKPPRVVKPRKIGTLNTMVDDEDDGEVAPVPAAKPARKPSGKKPAPAAPAPVAAFGAGRTVESRPAEPAAPRGQRVLGLADVYSKIVQWRIDAVSTTISLCVAVGLVGVALAMGAGLVPVVIAAFVAFLAGCGIHWMVKTSLVKYLGVSMMGKAVGFVFGVTLAAVCMALGLWFVAVPFMLVLIGAVGANGLLLEYRVAQLGTGEVQVVETITVGTGGFDADAVPADKK